LLSGATGLHDIQTRHHAQRFGDCFVLPAADLFRGDDGDRAADLALGRGNSGCSDNDRVLVSRRAERDAQGDKQNTGETGGRRRVSMHGRFPVAGRTPARTDTFL